MKIWNNRATFLCTLLSFAIVFHQTNGYDSRDPHGNITIRWDVMSPTPDGYVAVVNITNYQKYRKVDAPGWKLSWTWPHNEFIWATLGARAGDQGNCDRFKKGRSVPATCSKSPAIFDLTAEVPQSEKIDGCCKGGVLLSRLQGYNESTTAFQIAVGGAGSENTTWRVPTNYTFRAPRGEYSCSEARVVAPTRFITPDRRRVTQAYKTWKVECSYKPPSQNRVPLCCVSLSSDHGMNTSCPTCSCSCQNQTHSCSTKNHDRLVSKIECTDHMCPVNINWHVMSKVEENHERKIRVTISNLNYARNYPDWIVLVEHPALGYSTGVIHANHRFLSSSNYRKMEVVWGRKGHNQVLAPFGTNGSTTNFVLVFKGRARHGTAREWRSPEAIFFNGDRCVSPLPTQF
ncbi:COBRA-like protein [Trema orientale]|uniref:COBRA-like protein n=1 Tax=Trema orientale TaxID=63057 RepID=A0A2P5C1T0_TREOI|nr:COBRA-like protein [Trema orientale]